MNFLVFRRNGPKKIKVDRSWKILIKAWLSRSLDKKRSKEFSVIHRKLVVTKNDCACTTNGQFGLFWGVFQAANCLNRKFVDNCQIKFGHQIYLAKMLSKSSVVCDRGQTEKINQRTFSIIAVQYTDFLWNCCQSTRIDEKEFKEAPFLKILCGRKKTCPETLKRKRKSTTPKIWFFD